MTWLTPFPFSDPSPGPLPLDLPATVSEPSTAGQEGDDEQPGAPRAADRLELESEVSGETLS
jgi:hypothetical protein